MFRPFAHYLSYGATDQQTARRLAGYYTGLLVPGTVAAFQRAGTGGFVLTLSATAAAPEYVIDSRFPLFQQRLPSPKRSHEALAELLGAPELIRAVDPTPSDFTDELIERVAANWVSFNQGYTSEARTSFAKYAQKLGEEIEPASTRGPTYVMPPYLICQSDSDWWAVSTRLYDATIRQIDPRHVVRVVAADSAARLAQVLPEVREERVAIWVSGLNELTSSSNDLRTYASSIMNARQRGTSQFALYGGFFSVMLRAVGLSGSSHGIGFGESRDWVELPQSGPPPARYYLPLAHRYVSQDLAYQIWSRNPPLAQCDCAACGGEPPIALDYQRLMDHSVLCRASEIRTWAVDDVQEVVARLEADRTTLQEGILELGLPGPLLGQAQRSYEHLARWSEALGSLA